MNVETLAAPVEGNWIIDTERCTELNEDECEKQPFVHFVRIYYEFGNQLSEQIAIHDFVPVQHDWDSLLAVLNYEPFSSVLRRASTWLRNQEPGTRLLSAQLVEVPLPKSPPSKIRDSHRTDSISDDSRSFRVDSQQRGARTNVSIWCLGQSTHVFSSRALGIHIEIHEDRLCTAGTQRPREVLSVNSRATGLKLQNICAHQIGVGRLGRWRLRGHECDQTQNGSLASDDRLVNNIKLT